MLKENPDVESRLSRREREVMEVIFRKNSATARDVWTALGENRSYSTIRKILSILEDKGHLSHQTKGAVFVFFPRVAREQAASSALRRLVDTFYQGSVTQAVSGLLGEQGNDLSTEELDRLTEMIADAKKQNREGGK